MRPLKCKGGPEDLPKLKQAQQIRATVESVLAQASHLTVLGHSQMSTQLGASYLVAMFRCAGQIPCLTKLAAPLTNAGLKSVFAGDYYVTGGVYKFHVFRYSLASGAIEKEVNFDLSNDDVESLERWHAGIAPFFAAEIGRVQISISVPGAICRVDGEPCHFEGDDKTVVLPLGEHTIEASKDGFVTQDMPVTVEPGATKPISITLVADAKGELRVPAALGRRAPSIPVVRAESAPRIDGKLDEQIWAQSWVDPNFTQNFPDEGKPPTQKTELRVLYDNDAIYVGIRCFDSNPDKISARLTRRDRDIDSDKVTVDISSKNDRASSYHFEVTAAGVQIDGIRFDDTSYGSDWDGRWYSDVSRDAEGWTAELAIPLVSLRYNGDVTAMGFQVRRIIPRNGEIDEWSYVPRTSKGEVSYYGQIDGMSGLQAKRLTELLGYYSPRFTFRRNQGVFDGTAHASEVGADVKLGLTPALTLNGTFNPDFGTVEVDQTVVNLTTVETYFPEKRPFFLEGAELFSTPFTLFYSRRIGAKPPSPALTNSASQLEPTPAEGRIWGAVNVTGLVAPRTSIGVIDAVTADQDALILRGPAAEPEKVNVDPVTNFAVVRLRNEFGTNSSIGLLTTAVNRFEKKGAAAPVPGDLCPVPYTTNFTSGFPPPPNKGRCTNDAYTAGIDGALRSNEGEYAVTGQILGSAIQNGPTRMIPDGTRIGSGAKGWGMVLDAGRYGGDTHWLYYVHYKSASPRLQINDAGYLGSANFHEWIGEVKWRTTKPTDHLLSAVVAFNLSHNRDWKLKDNLNLGPELTTTLTFKNFWALTLRAQPYFPRWVENRETQDGARVERNHATFGGVSLSTNPSKSVVLSFTVLYVPAFKDPYTRTAMIFLSAVGTLSLKPTPALELDLSPSYENVADNERAISATDNGDGTTTYLFNELDYQSLSITARGTYTFTRTLTLQGYVQTLLAEGKFSNPLETTASGKNPLLTLASFKPSATTPIDGFREGTLNVNLFLRWEYRPLSALWLVYTHSQDQKGYDAMAEGNPRLRFDRFGGGPATDVILAKLTYLWH